MGRTKGGKNILSYLRSETLPKRRSRSHHHQGPRPERRWDNVPKTSLSVVTSTWFGFFVIIFHSVEITSPLSQPCLSPLCTLTPSHDSRHQQTVFVAGLSLWRTGVNWMVTALPARRAVWCCVWPPPPVFDENQTDLAEVWASTEAGRLVAHRRCRVNSGTAWDRWDYVLPGRDVTSPGGFCCLQRDAWSVFSIISYCTDSDETIQGTKMGRESWTVTHLLGQIFFFFLFPSHFTAYWSS